MGGGICSKHHVWLAGWLIYSLFYIVYYNDTHTLIQTRSAWRGVRGAQPPRENPYIFFKKYKNNFKIFFILNLNLNLNLSLSISIFFVGDFFLGGFGGDFFLGVCGGGGGRVSISFSPGGSVTGAKSHIFSHLARDAPRTP